MMTDNGVPALFWCGLVMVLMVLVHEVSRLMPCRTRRYLFLPPGPGRAPDAGMQRWLLATSYLTE